MLNLSYVDLWKRNSMNSKDLEPEYVAFVKISAKKIVIEDQMFTAASLSQDVKKQLLRRMMTRSMIHQQVRIMANETLKEKI